MPDIAKAGASQFMRLKPGRRDVERELEKFWEPKDTTDDFKKVFRMRMQALAEDHKRFALEVPEICSSQGFERICHLLPTLNMESNLGWPWQNLNGYNFDVFYNGDVITLTTRGCANLQDLFKDTKRALSESSGREATEGNTIVALATHFSWWVREVLDDPDVSKGAYVVFGKNDMYKVKKVIAGSTRTIQACDWRLKLLWLYYLKDQGEQWVYSEETQHVCCLPLESATWERKLGHLQHGTWSFDLSGNDRLMPGECIDDAFRIYFKSMILNPTQSSEKLIDFLRATTNTTFLVVGKLWCIKQAGNPSGMPNTIWLNTVCRQCSTESVLELEGMGLDREAARYCGDDAIYPPIPGHAPEDVVKAFEKHTPWTEKIEGVSGPGTTAHFVSRQTCYVTVGGCTVARPYYVAPLKQLVSVFIGGEDQLAERAIAFYDNNAANFYMADKLRGTGVGDDVVDWFDEVDRTLSAITGRWGRKDAVILRLQSNVARYEGGPWWEFPSETS
jgi:hypothetical protein